MGLPKIAKVDFQQDYYRIIVQVERYNKATEWT